MNKITLEQATAIVGASLAEGWMEAANRMIEKAVVDNKNSITIKKFGTIFEDSAGNIHITGFHFYGTGNSVTVTEVAKGICERLLKDAEKGIHYGGLTLEKVKSSECAHSSSPHQQ